jgi:hypothetical protein
MAHGLGTSGSIQLLVFVTLRLAALAGSLIAQTPTATLSGTVRDSTGAVVANAKSRL